ncbi:MAG TPA: enoyl-CoA hydratase-related protein, partial [Streptosporangiaceae bacterium]|nr:enoyl-CoA hydratase-related protein [Streptosporangiaceae bacterium]
MDDELTRRYETVEVNRDGAAVKIALNRPDRMNAWSDGLSQDLLAVLREVAGDETVRAVMLTGNGRAFCSGADLKDGADDAVAGQLDTYTTLTRWYHPIVTAIRQMPKPVLTAVNGPAAGAGLSLALAGDLVVAAESAYFMLAFVGIGLVPDGGASLFVPSRVGFARAAQMAMLGERVSAAQAVDWGLINSAWPDAEFAAKAEALLTRLAAGPTRSYAGSKRELNHWMYDRMAAHLELEATIQGELATSADFIEGVSAFLQKRPP